MEKGNRVQFGPKVEDNFIENVESGEKVYLRNHGRSYVLDVGFMKKNTKKVSHSFQRPF